MILNALEKFQLKAIDLLGLVLVVKTDEQELIFESVLNNRTKKKKQYFKFVTENV